MNRASDCVAGNCGAAYPRQSPQTARRKRAPRKIENTCHLTVDFPCHARIVRKTPQAKASTATANIPYNTAQLVLAPGSRRPAAHARNHLRRNRATPIHKDSARTLSKTVARLTLVRCLCSAIKPPFAYLNANRSVHSNLPFVVSSRVSIPLIQTVLCLLLSGKARNNSVAGHSCPVSLRVVQFSQTFYDAEPTLLSNVPGSLAI